MAKNNYVIQYEKRIAELRKKLRIDSAYLGCGFVLTLDELGFSQDDIETIMEKINESWQKVFALGVNPLKYCEEQTGIRLITEEQAEAEINKYFDEGEQEQ